MTEHVSLAVTRAARARLRALTYALSAASGERVTMSDALVRACDVLAPEDRGHVRYRLVETNDPTESRVGTLTLAEGRVRTQIAKHREGGRDRQVVAFPAGSARPSVVRFDHHREDVMAPDHVAPGPDDDPWRTRCPGCRFALYALDLGTGEPS